jgi:hypothetical protein
MSAGHVINLLENADNNDLPAVEERFKRLRSDISILKF